MDLIEKDKNIANLQAECETMIRVSKISYDYSLGFTKRLAHFVLKVEGTHEFTKEI